ncbi:hypothetical protein [Citrobacter amalonaticus]|uniref:hypothetical protein n=1 Tax=Citrobacter amalonaticus TaxID=35703 RepID=UPI002251D251|nr:hypothetical protein [Citrobacter amalonaticus]
MVAILPAGPLQKCRAADTAAEVESYTRYILSLRQFAGYVSIRSEVSRFPGSSVPVDYQRFLSVPDLWSMLHCAGNNSVNPAPAATSAPFTLRAAACIAVRLCCRVAVNLHQNLRSFAHRTRPVRHFRRAKRQSDAQPPHRAIPLFSGFWRLFPNLTRLFGAAVSKKEEKKIDTEGGMTPRRIPAHAGSLYRVQSETPYTSTSCHSGVKVSFWRSQKAYAGDCLCFQYWGDVWVS